MAHSTKTKLDIKKTKCFIILGFGKTAISSAEYLAQNFPEAKIKISELKEEENFSQELIEKLKTKNIEFKS